MQKNVKQVLGVDVAQKELVVCLGKMQADLCISLYASKTFSNNVKGFKELLAWVNKLTDASLPVRYVMEATGVYHESFAYFLYEQAKEVSIVVPNKISNYARTLDIKTITDKTAAEAITRFGLERNLDQWIKPNAAYKKIRQLCRERGQLVDERTVLKNQLHAENAEAEPSLKSIQRTKKRISIIDKQIQEVEEEMRQNAKTDAKVSEEVKLLTTIPGIGILTALTILSETNGFELIKNKRQLVSYAGLDVREKQSGTSVKGKPRISKKGNKYLRKAMHLPALAAIRSTERYKAIFARLVGKHGIKMKAAVAVQRKLLEMAFTVHKKQIPFDKNYFNIKLEELETSK
jgi:transposase